MFFDSETQNQKHMKTHIDQSSSISLSRIEQTKYKWSPQTLNPKTLYGFRGQYRVIWGHWDIVGSLPVDVLPQIR